MNKYTYTVLSDTAPHGVEIVLFASTLERAGVELSQIAVAQGFVVEGYEERLLRIEPAHPQYTVRIMHDIFASPVDISVRAQSRGHALRLARERLDAEQIPIADAKFDLVAIVEN